MKRLVFDFETRSSLDIKLVGMHRYLRTPQSDIICLGYKVEGEKLKLWQPGMPPPFDPMQYRCYAFNAEFDWSVWNVLGPKYGFPHMPLSQVEDIMALCGRYTYPQQLDTACRLLNKRYMKSPSGARLMNIITQPPFKYTAKQMETFLKYCLQDVLAEEELLSRLPYDTLSPEEREIWELTIRINQLGLPVDVGASSDILTATLAHIKRQALRLHMMTDGHVTKPTQTQRIVKWCALRGVDIPNLQKATVKRYLEEELDMPEDVAEVLRVRQLVGLSSLAKYKSIIDQAYNGRIYGNLQFYGASTGRWAGRGFQAHNLPRASVKGDPERYITAYTRLVLDPDAQVTFPVAETAKALIRPMIKARNGKILGVADYSGIENRILCWLANDGEALRLFEAGRDQYKDMAAFLFNKPYDAVTDEERFFGKTLVLGCGYGLGSIGFIGYAKGYGLDITDDYASFGVTSYRDRYNLVVKMWYQFKDCALKAINHPGTTHSFAGCHFSLFIDRTGVDWLRILLPSGRSLFYNRPFITQGLYGDEPGHHGWSSVIHKWTDLKLIPGRITENIVQALARDVLAHGKLLLNKLGYKIILSIHDEIVCELDHHVQVQDTMYDMMEIMTRKPEWCRDLPLAAEGKLLKRYKKL